MAGGSSTLTGNDAAVLGALFDPEASLRPGTVVEDSLPEGLDAASLRAIQSQERDGLIPLNNENPSKDEIIATISDLTQLITRTPRYASAWNNRGQARRMLFNLGPVHAQTQLLSDIISDLDQAIALASPRSPVVPLPAVNAIVLASAHTHRGLLFWAAARSTELRLALGECTDRLKDADSERLEELASIDFAAGGRYGNDTAKQLAVKLNPYAKLCGSIVKEAMQKEISDFYQIPVARVS